MIQGSSRDGNQPLSVVLNSRISVIEKEILSVDAEIESLRQLRKNLVLEREGLLSQLNATSRINSSLLDHGADRTTATEVDYTGSFDWTNAMKVRMKAIFGIESYRHCQEAWVASASFFL